MNLSPRRCDTAAGRRRPPQTPTPVFPLPGHGAALWLFSDAGGASWAGRATTTWPDARAPRLSLGGGIIPASRSRCGRPALLASAGALSGTRTLQRAYLRRWHGLMGRRATLAGGRMRLVLRYGRCRTVCLTVWNQLGFRRWHCAPIGRGRPRSSAGHPDCPDAGGLTLLEDVDVGAAREADELGAPIGPTTRGAMAPPGVATRALAPPQAGGGDWVVPIVEKEGAELAAGPGKASATDTLFFLPAASPPWRSSPAPSIPHRFAPYRTTAPRRDSRKGRSGTTALPTTHRFARYWAEGPPRDPRKWTRIRAQVGPST